MLEAALDCKIGDVITLANAPSGKDGGMASGSFRPYNAQRISPFAANRAYPSPLVEFAFVQFTSHSERREAMLAAQRTGKASSLLVDPALEKFKDGDYKSHGKFDRRDSFYHYWETPVGDYGARLYTPTQTEDMILKVLRAGGTVVDIGIGGGTQWLNFFQKHKLDLHSINFYGTALTQTYNEALEGKVLICDSSKLHLLFEQNSVDLMLSHYGIYGPESHKLLSLKSIAHVLKPEGSTLLRVAGDMSDDIHPMLFRPASERKPIELVQRGKNDYAYYNETSLTLPHFWQAHIRKV